MSALCPNCGEYECDVTILTCDDCDKTMCSVCEAKLRPLFGQHLCTTCTLHYIYDTGDDPREYDPDCTAYYDRGQTA